MKIQPWQLKQRQALPLWMKEELTRNRIIAWYERWNGDVAVSFSGGKDSTVLLHMVRAIYPKVGAVFVDTGLEYPEIRDFVKSIENVKWLRPELKFKHVVEKYGYPVVSKAQARYISDVQNKNSNNINTVKLRLTGITSTGKTCNHMKISKKWLKLIDSKWKISDKCCDKLKHGVVIKHYKKTGLKPFVGTMASDSQQRNKSFYQTGCSILTKGSEKSIPISHWFDSDIFDYIKKYNVPYSKIYDMGEKRTGCMFCMFGVHLEKGENRFQRMAKTHPKQYDYCINKLGLGEILDFIGVNYRPIAKQQKLF